eukprot:CAMPEP_0177500662 /NCGR_PEP_ID=MMETSP0369-20130122/36792_1 /TAXON_ID=447022 ORGANISM="Scrippsiella hangoei-like, Strain SHHI-4" /NCGR_SAMPLE_ID=MMETSP0369 /ASSEMBLY_ACC=CAM_ASM_000364 /LENGTH=237 /DNA_ID=CAMNT_0018978079 /DNA_START=60 /DNA_END=770 /DNA_ORIENTATION=+
MPVLGLDEMDDGEDEDENSKEEPARVEEPPKIEESKQVQETIQVLVKDVPEPVAEPETKTEVVVVEKKEDGHQKTEKIEAPVAPPEPEREAATASPKEEFAPSDSQRSAGSGLGWKVSDKLQQWEERMSKPKDGVVTIKADGAVERLAKPNAQMVQVGGSMTSLLRGSGSSPSAAMTAKNIDVSMLHAPCRVPRCLGFVVVVRPPIGMPARRHFPHLGAAVHAQACNYLLLNGALLP